MSILLTGCGPYRNICLYTNSREADLAEHYARPDSLEEALDTLARGGVTIAAGCTDLYPATERKSLPGSILDITGIAALRGITRQEGWLKIGAATTWTEILRADLPPAFDGLKLAAREVGSIQIQNRGTIGGNLCNASPAADGVPPLLTLDAVAVLHSAAGTREVPLADLITGPRRTALRPDEMVTAILIPDAAMKGAGSFLKLGARKYLVISIAMAAARLEVAGGILTGAALAIGACGPVATRLPEVERAITGAPPDPARITDAAVAAALAPIDDIRADAAYRHVAAAELLRRAVAALAPAGEAAA
ncbi:xanthine dehydrogenase family protein subunit M [Rhodobacteraceae bacterium NNCM2]|nr:xanthine dehydrogenase family protein subunit M [Coraliihabitans acroporae]